MTDHAGVILTRGEDVHAYMTYIQYVQMDSNQYKMHVFDLIYFHI